MGKITEYTAATDFDSGDDVILKDGTNGTRKMLVSNAALAFANQMPAIMHRNIYRGKSLGSSVTSAQKSAISEGTFDGLFIGDYWTIKSVDWIIADMDYWYKTGDTSFATHHVVVIPASNLYTAQMNSSNTTEGGYVGSEMYTANLETAKTTISSAFGSLLLTHREYLTNAVTDGHPSGGAWYDSSVELMNEIMVYGTGVYTPRGNGSTNPNLYTIDKQQLALYRLYPGAHNEKRSSIWLRDVVSASGFAIAYGHGHASYLSASNSYGVRPVFPVGVS